jgi:hypothetical protein
VKRLGIKYYALATGDEQQDAVIEVELVTKARQAIVPDQPISAQAACTARPNNLGGDYLVNPNDANSTRVFFTVTYTVHANCAVTDIETTSQVSKGVWNWLYSCVRGLGNSCTNHNIQMDINPSPKQRETWPSEVGARYAHVSERPAWNLGRPYTERTFR